MLQQFLEYNSFSISSLLNRAHSENNLVWTWWAALSTLFFFFIAELCCWRAWAWPWSCWSCGRWRAWSRARSWSLSFFLSFAVTVTVSASFATAAAFTAFGRTWFRTGVRSTATTSEEKKQSWMWSWTALILEILERIVCLELHLKTPRTWKDVGLPSYFYSHCNSTTSRTKYFNPSEDEELKRLNEHKTGVDMYASWVRCDEEQLQSHANTYKKLRD